MPNVSARDSSDDISPSNTFTSPEYINVNSATIAPKDAPGSTITGWNGGSKVRNKSEKNVLHALNTTRCALTVRPSAESVTSVKCDWSSSRGKDDSKLVWKGNYYENFCALSRFEFGIVDQTTTEMNWLNKWMFHFGTCIPKIEVENCFRSGNVY